MKDINIRTVDVREIKKIIATERQITESKRTAGLSYDRTAGKTESHLETTLSLSLSAPTP